MRHLTVAAALAAAVSPVAANARDVVVRNITISAPWSRETAPSAKVGAGFMTITNTGTQPDTLLRARSAVAGETQVHTMSMDGGAMRMRELKNGLPLPPKQMVKLAPGGFHIMLMQLKTPLKRGTTVPVTLTFARAGDVTVRLAVQPIGATGPAS